MIADVITASDNPLMKLDVKKVEGLTEKISLISAKNFAIGQETGKIYNW